MADAAPQTTTASFQAKDMIGPFRRNRLIVAVIFGLFAVMFGEFGQLTRELMVDAYVQVSAFVAATLILFYGAERVFNFDIGQVLKSSKQWQVPLAALMGTMPGCGGAVVVVAAYSSGNVGFGAVVATLTATMGDAAFLLIATRPDAAIVVLPLSLLVGILTGWIVDRFDRVHLSFPQTGQETDLAPTMGRIQWKHWIFGLIAIPGLVIGVTQLAFFDPFEVYGHQLVMAIGLAGTAIGLTIWATSPLKAMSNAKDHPITRMAEETSFISVWVIGAYLAYDYVAVFSGIDIEAAFNAVLPLLPLIAVIIGFIPGCGPQVLVTTLYINGIIPFAALMGNAISNDGDALFPAIALNPKAAVYATLYSGIPALLLAYGFFFVAPNFLN